MDCFASLAMTISGLFENRIGAIFECDRAS
jgi:hypothetical protein